MSSVTPAANHPDAGFHVDGDISPKTIPRQLGGHEASSSGGSAQQAYHHHQSMKVTVEDVPDEDVMLHKHPKRVDEMFARGDDDEDWMDRERGGE